jgi:hypothetical protein
MTNWERSRGSLASNPRELDLDEVQSDLIRSNYDDDERIETYSFDCQAMK